MVNNNKTMFSKILLVFFSMLIVSANAFSYTIETDYDTINSNFAKEDLIAQNVNNINLPQNVSSIYPISFILTTKPMYVKLNSVFENTSIQFNTPNTNPDSFNLTQGEDTWFQVTPSFSGEYLTLVLPGDEYIVYEFYLPNDNERDTSLLSLIQPFTTAIADLVTINISIWRLGFFLLIVIIPLGFLALIVWGIFKAIEWARHINEVKEEVMQGRRRR